MCVNLCKGLCKGLFLKVGEIKRVGSEKSATPFVDLAYHLFGPYLLLGSDNASLPAFEIALVRENVCEN